MTQSHAKYEQEVIYGTTYDKYHTKLIYVGLAQARPNYGTTRYVLPHYLVQLINFATIIPILLTKTKMHFFSMVNLKLIKNYRGAQQSTYPMHFDLL